MAKTVVRALHSRNYETALTPDGWEYLCRFLKIELTAVLAVTGPELWQAVQRQIKLNQRTRFNVPLVTAEMVSLSGDV